MNGPGELFGPASPLVQLAPFGLILVVFYFLLVRPQQKRARETKEMLGNLKLNDEVVTSGGLHGKVVKLSDKVLTLEIAPKVHVRVDRPSVGAVVRNGKASEEKSA